MIFNTYQMWTFRKACLSVFRLFKRQRFAKAEDGQSNCLKRCMFNKMLKIKTSCCHPSYTKNMNKEEWGESFRRRVQTHPYHPPATLKHTNPPWKLCTSHQHTHMATTPHYHPPVSLSFFVRFCCDNDASDFLLTETTAGLAVVVLEDVDVWLE